MWNTARAARRKAKVCRAGDRSNADSDIRPEVCLRVRTPVNDELLLF
jgi:hypothetical protein